MIGARADRAHPAERRGGPRRLAGIVVSPGHDLAGQRCAERQHYVDLRHARAGAVAGEGDVVNGFAGIVALHAQGRGARSHYAGIEGHEERHRAAHGDEGGRDKLTMKSPGFAPVISRR